MARRIENRAKTARRSFRVLGVTVKRGLAPVGLSTLDRSLGTGVGSVDIVDAFIAAQKENS